MATTSYDVQQRLLDSTKEASAAFLEDVAHIRRIISRSEQDRSEIRHLSNIMRRLLVDKDLTKIASPRIGKFMLDGPDNSAVYQNLHNRKVESFVSGGPQLFGFDFRALLFCKPSLALGIDVPFDPMRTVKLHLDGFLGQKVIAFRGEWVDRRDVIKYIANVCSGVHSGAPSTAKDALLNRMRKTITAFREQDGMRFSVNAEAMMGGPITFQHTPGGMDLVLMEVYCSAHYLVFSEDTNRLENKIKTEFSS